MVRANPQSGCFVCGPENPKGLHIHFELQPDGQIGAGWTPGAECEGFTGIVHGGAVAAALDEAMSKAVTATATEALTAELRVRYRARVCSGATFQIRSWVVRRNKRLIETEAVLTGADGAEYAHAWARFLSLPKAC